MGIELMFPGSRKAALKIETYVVRSVVQRKKRCSLFPIYYIRREPKKYVCIRRA